MRLHKSDPPSSPRRFTAVPDDLPRPKRPDPALPLIAAAFALGIVVTAVAGLGLRLHSGDTVPARQLATVGEQLAAERAARDAQAQRVAGLAASLQSADELAQRLVAVLGTARPSAAEIAALRREVAAQHTTIRDRIRVVRVPVPVTPARHAPQSVRPTPSPSPSPSVSPSAMPVPPCALEALGVCVAR